MLAIRRILFPTDFSECAEQAFTQAAHLAERFDAELHVLNVGLPHVESANDPMGFLELVDEAPHTQSDAAFTAETGARVVHAQVRVLSPAAGILDYASAHDIDLIVMGTHGRRGLNRLLIGSVAEEVVRLARCPVFTIRASEDAPVRFERILAPVDFSAFSSVAVAYAKALAALYGARLDLLHVVEEVTLPGPYGIEPMPTVTSGVADRAQEALLQMAAALPGEVPVEAHVLVGHAARDVLDFAAIRHTDLVVIATHGRTGIARLLLGSVAEKVVRMAPCPVFTIKSFGKRLMPELPLEAAEAPPRPKPGGLLPRAAAVL